MGEWGATIVSTLDKRWICLAMAAVALAIATLVLARFRVIQSRPLAACVVLSLFAHLLLFVAAYWIDFFETPGFGGGPAIHFRLVAGDGPTGVLVDEPEPSSDREKELPQEWSAADLAVSELPNESPRTEPELVRLEPDSPPERSLENLVAPELLRDIDVTVEQQTRPEPVPPEILVAQEGPVVLAPQMSPSADDIVEPAPSHGSDFDAGGWTPLAPEEIQVDRSDESNRSEVADRPDSDRGTSHSRFGHRLSTERGPLLQMYGGNADTERAVREALRWLAEHQSPDGRWIAADYGAGTAGVIDFQDRRGTGLKADTGVTALALLAMMGAGETPTRGDYQENLQRGFDFLCRSQSTAGDLAGNADHFARMYCHGIATLALGEVCSIAPHQHWEQTLHRALDYSRASQHRVTGGWRYQAGDTGDTSQFGWQVMALVSGQNAGLPIHPTTRYGMEQFLRSVSSGDAGGLASYRHFLPPSPSMTAESLVCRLLLRPELSPAVDEAVRYVLAHPPDEPVLNLYYCYYGSLALHLSNASWDSWNQRMQSAILSRQVQRGEHSGSWGIDSVWGRCGGRVYTTAMATLSLEVYYRYLPLVDRTLARR